LHHVRRLFTGVLLAAVVAVPEALIRSGDGQVAFQTWLVVQLLGVIIAAIAVAAIFSVVGLGLVRLATLPWRNRASTFVAWSFLRAPRVREPMPVRAWQFYLHQVDAQRDAPPANWRNAVELLVLLLFGGAGTLLLLQSADLSWPLLFLRNALVWLGFHTLLLACAALPWRSPRAVPLALAGAVGLLAACWFARTPVILSHVEPFAILLGFVLASLLGGLRIGGEVGRAERLQRRGLLVAALALVALIPALLLPAAKIPALSLALPLGLIAGYLVLQGQAKVSVPVFVSIVGVAAGVWALIVVLSVMGGFAHDLRQKMLVANAHALIERPGRVQPLQHVADLAGRLRKIPGVAALSPQVRGDAILSSAFNVNNFVAVRGVDPSLPEVQRELGGTLVTGGLALLQRPTSLASDRALGRKAASEPEDMPPAPPVPPAPKPDESDMNTLMHLAPGPTEPSPPQPVRPTPVDPRLLLMPTGGAVRMIGSGGGQPKPEAVPDAIAIPGRATDDVLLPAPNVHGLDDAPFLSTRVDMPVAPGILLGTELARSLQVELGDRVEVITPDGDIGPTGLRPRVRTFRVAGTFETGLYEADSKVAYVTLSESVRYFNLDGEANVLELRLDDPEHPDAVLAAVRQTLRDANQPNDVETIDWREMNRSLFSALAFERLVVFLVLTLIILVAGFSIVSALTMVILQKRDGISMLRAMGATAATIRSAFVQMGGSIGLIGTTAGAILGLGTCLLIERLGIQLPEAYYVRTLPVRIQPAEIAAVALAAVALSLVATVFPATSAARFTPLEGLRHG
jgi:ABC-type lipoprotein release transport system permease subunit